MAYVIKVKHGTEEGYVAYMTALNTPVITSDISQARTFVSKQYELMTETAKSLLLLWYMVGFEEL